MAAIAITLVDVAVWGPIIFITGVTGAFLRNFAIVMVAATLASLLVSFTLTPLIASRWLQPAAQRRSRALLGADRARILGAGLPRAGAAATRRRCTGRLRHRPLVLRRRGAGVRAQLRDPAAARDGVRARDRTRHDATVVGELPPGTALEATDRAAKRWEQALLDNEQFPEIETAYVLVGRGDADFDRDPRFISVTLDLGEPSTRARTQPGDRAGGGRGRRGDRAGTAGPRSAAAMAAASRSRSRDLRRRPRPADAARPAGRRRRWRPGRS